MPPKPSGLHVDGGDSDSTSPGLVLRENRYFRNSAQRGAWQEVGAQSVLGSVTVAATFCRVSCPEKGEFHWQFLPCWAPSTVHMTLTSERGSLDGSELHL